MSYSSSDIDRSSITAEYEGTPPSTRPTTFESSVPSGTMLNTITVPIPMEMAGPILAHLATVTKECEDIVISMTKDMNMSTQMYFLRRILFNEKELRSQLDLTHLNNVIQAVVYFTNNNKIMGYMGGIALNRVRRACDENSNLLKSLMDVATKARLFARCNRKRVNRMKDHMVTTLANMRQNVSKLRFIVEQRLGGLALPGWEELLSMVEFALEAWEQVGVDKKMTR